MIRKLLFFALLPLLLIACSNREASPDSEETGNLALSFNVATASGKVLPTQRALMSYEVGGRLVWSASEGSQVRAGDEIARLDDADAEAALDMARAGLAVAEANLRLLSNGARTEEIVAAEGSLIVAQTNVAAAEERLAQARENSTLIVDAAQADLDRARGSLEVAQAELDRADAIFTNSDPRFSAAQAQVRIAEAGVLAAQVAVQQAQLSSASNVTMAELDLRGAQGRLDQAQAQRDALVAGPTVDELSALEAQVSQAKAMLAQAEAAERKTVLLAPFAGSVGAVYLQPGESVRPGQPVISLGDLTELRVETTDFNEVDAIQVSIGAPATLTFDALPGLTVDGEIVQIAPMAATGQGGTNFTLIIEMQSPPQDLRWGMTAFVDVPLQ
jgi:multidrug resistance efflux pump